MRSRLFVVAAAAVLTLAACGSDADSSEGAETTVAADTAAVDTVADTAGADGSADTTAVDADFSGEGSGAFCALATEFDENDPTADLFTSDDPEQLKTDWAKAQELIGTLTDEAPDEIKPDFELITSGFSKIGDLYAKYDWDFQKLSEAAATDPDIAALSDTAETDAASARVDAYLQQVCGINTED